ncbi:MAG: SDR family NAD(P)-dependent oxidoreductase [Candidatus Sulfotelmatobacter sp.]
MPLAARQLRRGRLRGKIVLITGGSRGLGLALAEELGREGAKLALSARDGSELARARDLLLKRHCVREPDNIFLFPADLRNAQDAEELILQTTRRFGRIDILINNAGIITVGPVENQTVADFRDVMDTNFFSGLHCTLAVLPEMLARKDGAIVNITSIGGKVAVPHLLPYTASKFAAVGFSEGLSAELRGKGIRVTTVCPGLMRTGSHLNAQFKGQAEREYRWFSVAAGVPGLSTSVRAAARKIVAAISQGKREIAITPQAIFAARLSDLMPAVTSMLLQLISVTLPSAPRGVTAKYRGAEVRDMELRPLTVFANAAARRYNQTG